MTNNYFRNCYWSRLLLAVAVSTSLANCSKDSDSNIQTQLGQPWERAKQCLSSCTGDFLEGNILEFEFRYTIDRSDNYEAVNIAVMPAYSIAYFGKEVKIYTPADTTDFANWPIDVRDVVVGLDEVSSQMSLILKIGDKAGNFHFEGNQENIPALIAYLAANKAAFPLSSQEYDLATHQLSVFNQAYVEDALVLSARGSAIANTWWSADSTFSSCYESGGPASKLDEFIDFTDKPYTRDFKSPNGEIVKVEVINDIGGGRQSVWTYYRSKADCEAEQISATEILADKYR